MSLTHKIFNAVLFLTAFGFWSWISQKITAPAIKTGNPMSFWRRQAIELLSSFAIVTYIFLVSGYFNIKMLGLLVGAGELALLVGSASRNVTKFRGAMVQSRLLWQGSELAAKHKAWLVPVGLALSTVTFAYLFLTSVALFRHTGTELAIRIFQYTFFFLFFCGFFATVLLTVILGLTSEDLDEPTRTWVFMAELSALFSGALYLCVMLSALGFHEPGLQISFGGMTTLLAPQLLLIVLSYFILAVVAPFLVGSLRARRQRIELLERRRPLLDRFLETLDSPVVANHLAELETLRARIRTEMEQFSKQDRMIQWGDAMERGEKTPLSEFADAFKATRSLDPRFRYLDWLRQFNSSVEEAGKDLAGKPNPSDQKKAAEDWAKTYHAQHEEFGKQIAAERAASLPGAFLGAMLLLPVATIVVQEIGKWIWIVFMQGLPKLH
jgi:hypothetical protein